MKALPSEDLEVSPPHDPTGSDLSGDENIEELLAAESEEGSDVPRQSRKETIEDLCRIVSNLFRGAAVRALDAAEALERYAATGIDGDFHHKSDELHCLLFAAVRGGVPGFAVEIEFPLAPTVHVRLLAQNLIRVFNTDISRAPRYGHDYETWLSLEQTRVIRIMARIALVTTPFFTDCLRWIESARENTYEGAPVATRLLIVRRTRDAAVPAGERFIRLSQGVPIREALLSEKWIRPFTAQGMVALVATQLTGKVTGVVVSFDRASNSPSGTELEGEGDPASRRAASIESTAFGDIWVKLPNGMRFLRRRGSWQYIDFGPIEALIAPFATPEIARALLLIAFDASVERRGALLAITNNPKTIREIIPRAAQPADKQPIGVGDLVKRLDILNLAHATLIRSAAAVDGAVILSKDGKVIEAGCLVTDPPAQRLDELGLATLDTFPGARATAARNCSIYGVAIKVSDDGQISLFVAGKMVLEFG